MMLVKAAVHRTARVLICCALWAAGCGDNVRVIHTIAPDHDEICNTTEVSKVVTPVPDTSGGGGGAPAVDVRIHYNRADGQYTGWGLHVWQVNDAGQYLADYPGVTWGGPLQPAGTDAYGPYFLIEASKITNPAAAGVGFIVHQGDTKDTDGDRQWAFQDGGELWLKSSDPTVYRSNPAGGLDIDTVRVHYKRFDASYDVWGLHLWPTSGIDVARLPGLELEQWNNPVPLASMPNYAAAPDGSEVVFDVPVLNPTGDPGRVAVEFIVHGLPSNPSGGVDNKDGWSTNPKVVYAGLKIADRIGEVWLVQEEPRVFTSVPNTRLASTTDARAFWLSRSLLRWPRVDTAGTFALHHSATGQIVARAGEAVTGADGSLPLTVYAGSLPPAITDRFRFVGVGVTLQLADPEALAPLLTSQLVVVQQDADGKVLGATTAQIAGLLDDRFAAAAQVGDLGVSLGGGRTTFKLWAPTAQHVTLCVTHPGRRATSHAMRKDPATGVWSASQRGEIEGRYYRYAVEVFARGVGLVRNLVTDPYSISLDADSQRSYIADLGSPSLKPSGWDEHPVPQAAASQEDMTIYELHVRDFSLSDPTVPAEHRGKYLAFTDRESAGMMHLRGLATAGLTDVHLLPVFDIASVPELRCLNPVIPDDGADSEAQQAAIDLVRDKDCFNWGYDPWHYTAPEGSYASDPTDGARRVRELRAMVMALHQAGLRVGMDVVYNHTSASGQSDRSVLDRIVPGYYHRLSAGGQIERSTCCENTATENLMMGKLMIDSAVTWTRHYKIDSFRFDLMGHQPRAAMEALKAAVDAAAARDVFLVGEGWNFGEVANGARFVQASQLSLNGSGIGTFSDRARDHARGGGPFDGGDSLVQNQGFTNGLFYDDNGSGAGKTRADLMRSGDMIKVGLAGSIRTYTLTTSTDATVELQQLDYNGQPAGYVTDPQEVVNYVENHDNQTLFDINAYKLPLTTTRDDRARVQMLGAALTTFSQGVAYFHAGIDTLRSKSMDRNSYNSGDWFNRLDWSYADNNFGVGAPPKADNGDNWFLIKPRLANADLKPTMTEIRWTKDAFRDLLAIRASSRLFRLRSGDEIKQRLHFYNTGSQQEPTVVVGHLDGRGYDDAFDDVLYFINVDKVAHTLTLDAEKDKPYVLHPVQRAAAAADRRPADAASYQAATGTFTIPPRTAVVYVVE
jgi:pullulanase/glycogen debranching enzyme